jgi:tryptophan-rich sensory protein
VALALKMIPPEVMADCRARAEQEDHLQKPAFRAMAVVVVLIWAVLAALIIAAVYRRWFPS